MSEYWLTVQIDSQRTRDIRVSGDDYAAVAKKYREKDGYKVIAVRPCNKTPKTDG